MSRMGEYAMEQQQEDYPNEAEWWDEYGTKEEWYKAQDKDVKWESSHNKPETDMKISKLSEGKYLKKDDVEPPIKVTIGKITQEDLSMEGQPTEMKYVLHFNECKPLVLNMTNGQLISMALGSEETDDWVGKEIVLYNDASVMFAGKLTGGVRARGVKGTPETQSEDPSVDMEEPPF
jgi:hypothetical protein